MLEEARRLGFLGPGPAQAHLDHAAGFGDVIEGAFLDGDAGVVTGARAADLGSGAGVPALPLALRFADWQWVLVEAGARRAGFLADAVRMLGIDDRVQIVADRAEVVGRSPAYRGRCDLVVARSFGPPAVLVECAAPLLRVGGYLVVSEPPGGDVRRWPADDLALLEMRPEAAVRARRSTFQVLSQRAPCPERYPRRVGVPAKRPLF